MKISPKKKGQIYDLVHDKLVNMRSDLRVNYLQDDPLKDKIDYRIAQVEIPLAQAIMKLLQGKTE